MLSTLVEIERYFTQRKYCKGKVGFEAHQKETAVLRILAYGVCADSVDEKIAILESTAMESVDSFCRELVN